MAHFVAFFISFQKIIPSKIPPRGGGDRGYWWLKDYMPLVWQCLSISPSVDVQGYGLDKTRS